MCVVLLCNTLFSFKTARSGYLNLLSPTLFNIFLERIMTDTLEDHEGTVSLLLYVSLAHILLKAPNWQELSDLFVCLFLESILFVALKKRIPSKICTFFLVLSDEKVFCSTFCVFLVF